jgi:hypothetical protein
MYYMTDPNDAFFQNKGKGKKGKSKFSHMSDQEMFWNSKGKGPYHSKDGERLCSVWHGTGLYNKGINWC